jgi:uncharacterized protein YggT (Ycf19 family)
MAMASPMFAFLNLLQLVLYIACLALLGQGILYLLAGSRRDSNVFYQALRVVSKPFTVPLRHLTPRQLADRHVPVLAFLLLGLAYAVVTIEKIRWCVGAGLDLCR